MQRKAIRNETRLVAAPQSVTVCLEDELDISRGDMLVRPANQPALRRELEAMMAWLAEDPLRVGEPYLIKHLAASVRGVISQVVYRVNPDTLHREPAATLGLNEIGRVAVDLFRPIPADEYVRNRATGSFIVVDSRSNATVAAGMIIERRATEPRPQDEVARREAAAQRHHLGHERGLVAAADREQLLGQRPATVGSPDCRLPASRRSHLRSTSPHRRRARLLCSRRR